MKSSIAEKQINSSTVAAIWIHAQLIYSRHQHTTHLLVVVYKVRYWLETYHACKYSPNQLITTWPIELIWDIDVISPAGNAPPSRSKLIAALTRDGNDTQPNVCRTDKRIKG